MDRSSALSLLALVNEVLSQRIDKARGLTRTDIERLKEATIKWFKALRSALPAEIRDESALDSAYYDWLERGKELFAADYMRLGERVRSAIKPPKLTKKEKMRRKAVNYIGGKRPTIAKAGRSRVSPIVCSRRNKSIAVVVSKLTS